MNGSFETRGSASRLHLPTRRVPLELVLWHLIAEWEVSPKAEGWRPALTDSIAGFDERRTRH